jgi:hypothetical protein
VPLADAASGTYDGEGAERGSWGGSPAQALAAAVARQVPFVVVTDGAAGAAIAVQQQQEADGVDSGSSGMSGVGVWQVPPFWAPHGPVDVCGAGDAYAAGGCGLERVDGLGWGGMRWNGMLIDGGPVHDPRQSHGILIDGGSVKDPRQSHALAPTVVLF